MLDDNILGPLSISNPMSSSDLYPRDTPTFEWPTPSTSRFPLSFERPETQPARSATPPLHPPKPVSPRYDPLSILSSAPSSPPPSSYAHLDTLRPPEVSPGVLADGGLTVSFPPVRNFLASALEEPLHHPPPADKRVFALAALAVFYRPLHPAHWVFWSKDKKRITAHVVQELLDTKPPPIRSPIGWIAMSENLWILASMQHAYAGALTELSWYVPPQDTNETRMNLRKRKAQPLPQALGDSDSDVEREEELPSPKKRAKTRRTAASATTSTGAASQMTAPETTGIDVDSNDSSQNQAVPAQRKKRALIESPVLTGSASIPDEDGVDDKQSQPQVVAVEGEQEEDVPQVRSSLRQKEKEKRKKEADGEASPSGLSATSTLNAASIRSEQSPTRSSPSIPVATRGRSSSSASLSTGLGSGSSTAVSICDEAGAKKTELPESGSVNEEMSDPEDEEMEQEEEIQKKTTTRTRTRSRKAPARNKPSSAKKLPLARTTTSKGTFDNGKNKAKPEADNEKTAGAKSRARPKARPRRR